MVSTVSTAPPQTFADVVRRLGDVALDRIRSRPFPGAATEADCLQVNDSSKSGSCELVEGILVERPQMSYFEDSLATVLGCYLHLYLQKTRLGKGFSAGAIYRMRSGNLRVPDYSVCLKDKFPTGKVTRVPIADFAPDLAVEVLSRSNTVDEIARKRQELFESGTQLIWIVDPGRRVVEVHSPSGQLTVLSEADVLTGGELLPGFNLSISQWFLEAEVV
jgi:Uma2 family endonuclease